MKKIFSFVLISLFIAQMAFGAKYSRITLNDGTTIYGKVVGMKEGVYTVLTQSMGEVKIDSEKVLEISSNPANVQRNSNVGIIDGNNRKSTSSYKNNYSSNSNENSYSAEQEKANARVQSMVTNEDFLDNLMELSTSSEMQNVLNDPEIMEAISSGDYEFLMNSPKMKELMNSSTIQNMLGDM